MRLPKLRRRAGKPLDLVGAGVVLSTGGAVVGSLPSSAASSGVSQGLGAAGSYFPVMVNVTAGGYVVNQLRNLKKVKGRSR